MDNKSFEKVLCVKLEEKAIEEGLEDVKAGRVIDGNIVLEKIKKKCGF